MYGKFKQYYIFYLFFVIIPYEETRKYKMRNIKVGDRLQIHCYKHDGSFHRSCDEATILEITDDYLVCANYKTKIAEVSSDHKVHKYYTREPAIIFFYKNEWFNIIAQIKKGGLYYYCNMASPYIIDDETIKYIDYDLDLRVFPDGAFKILDRNEYRYHKKKMNYSEELETVLQYELSKLIDIKKKGLGPYDSSKIDYYYGVYKSLRKDV